MYNIYCDESCHLENDNQKSMVLGGIWCPSNKIKSITMDINSIKQKHGLSKYSELKWTKISPSKLNMYEDIINYFFSNVLFTLGFELFSIRLIVRSDTSTNSPSLS